jgi:hypothetical protein
MSTLTVLTDPRLRNLSALLAATDWPDLEQRPLPRGVHPHATMLRKQVSPFRTHAAARYLQAALETGGSLPKLFARVLNDEAEINGHLRAFAGAAALGAFWSEYESAWAQAVSEVQAHVLPINFDSFLNDLFDSPPTDLIIHPNIAYPTTQSLGVLVDNKAYSIMPPRKAVGESKPWPFADDGDYVARLAVHDFVQAQLFDLLNRQPKLIPVGENNDLLPEAFRTEFETWPKQVVELFAYAAQIIFLNRLEDGAGDSFAVFERRTRKLAILPGIVDEVTNYIAGKGLAQRYASLEVYLPYFTDQVNRLLYETKT